jgi:hypothetical protein
MAAKAKKQVGKQDKLKSTTQPVGDISELLAFWDREFDLDDGYRGLTVEVTGRKNNVLSFAIVEGSGKSHRRATGKDFSINLDDGMEAWSSLPSTAQDCDPESSQRVGYLFVTQAWLTRNQGDIKVMELPKWPRIASI